VLEIRQEKPMVFETSEGEGHVVENDTAAGIIEGAGHGEVPPTITRVVPCRATPHAGAPIGVYLLEIPESCAELNAQAVFKSP
jgi:hypothetical protein